MAIARKDSRFVRRHRGAEGFRPSRLAHAVAGLIYAGCVQAQTYVTPSGTYGPGSFKDAFQFFGTQGVIQGSTTIYPKTPYPFGAGGAGVSVAGGGSATINPDLGPQPGNIVIQSDYLAGAPNDALYVANGTLTVVGSADPSRLTYAMGHGQTVHGIYIPGDVNPSVFVGARMYMSADGQDANAIRGYGSYANATVSDSTLVATGASGHGVRLWDRAVATLVNTNVTVSGTDAFGVFATSNSTIDMTGGAVNTTLDSARGIYIDTSLGRLNGTSVRTQGANAYGIQAGASTLSVTGGTIATTGSAGHGLWLYGGTTATLNGATVGTTGASARGIYVSGAASAMVSQSDIGTQGSGATAAYLTGAGSSLTMTGGSLTTTKASAHGAYVASGAAFGATDTTISSALGVGVWSLGAPVSLVRGSVSGGLYAAYLQDGATLAAHGTSFTAGAGATRGVQSAGSNLDLTDVTVNTTASNNYGVYAYTAGTLKARNLFVNTAGQNGYGVRLIGVTSADISGATIRTSGAGAHGAVFEGGTHTYTGSDFDIATTGGGIGLYAWQNSAMSLAGGRIDTGTAASAHGLYIANATVALNPNSQGTGVGVTTGGAGANAAVIGAGGRLDATNASLHARGANAAGLYMFGATDAATANAIASGTLGTAPDAPVNDDGSPGVPAVMAPATLLADPVGGAEAVTLNGSSVVSDAGAAIRVLGRDATIAANRSSISGVMALQVQSLSNGATSTPGVATLDANASTLTGTALTEAGSQSTLNLANGSWWNMTGNSNLTSLTNAASRIQFAVPASGGFKTLTAVNYAGQGGTIGLNTYLGGTGSPSDKLVIDSGSAGGTSLLSIANAGGPGAVTVGNGIQVVDAVHGGTTAAGAFVLSGRAVAGAYEYRLYRGSTDGSNAQAWYLRSEQPDPPPPPIPDPPSPTPPSPTPPAPQPLYRPEVGAYLSNQRQAAGMFVHSLHDRQGEPQWMETQQFDEPADKRRSGWLRVVGKDGSTGSRDGNFDVDTRSWLIQGGGDVASGPVFKDKGESPGDRLHLGLMLGYGSATSDGSALGNPHQARGTAEGWSVGAYGTWYQNDADPQKLGWYADLWGTYGWFRNKVDGDELPEVKYDARALTLSGETGYAMRVRQDSDWIAEPQAQLVYLHYSEDDIAEPNGTTLSGSQGSGWISRLGVRLHRTWVSDNGRRTQPYLTLNWWHDNVDNDMRFNQLQLGDLYPSNRYEVKAGVNAQLDKGWTGWANLGYQWGSQGYKNVTGRIGAKYTW